jgi:CIC family chloride channel protein
VQIGAAAASAVGRRMRVSPQHMRTIVACGAAGGLAAVFNAPIGGAMFALEVITGELTPAFGAVILASVSATVVSRWFFGNYPSFMVPRYDLVSNWELLLYALFGIVAGLVSVGFIRMSESIENRFERLQVPARLKPALGGLLVGLIARFAPQILGTGLTTIEAATWGRLLPLTLALLVGLKMLATSTTLGSGGSGGVFGPSMYIGAVLGGAFGWAVHALLPASTAGSGAYALVGIGAVVGGTALAPLTAIILLFEMTDDYRIILPVMEATVLSIVVVRALVGESIYTLKLRQQNIPYYAGVELERARAATAAQAMRTDIPPIGENTDVLTAMAMAARLRAEALPVVNDAGEVIGLVTMARLAEAAAADPRPPSIASITERGDQLLAGTGDRLDAVLTRLGENEADALAVVASGDGKVPVGVISRRDIMRIYERALRRT